MSSPVWFSIPEFFGIRQDLDERLLPIGTASYAENIDTSDGNLSVAKGYTKYISTSYREEGVGPSDEGRKLIIPNGSDKVYVVTRSRIRVCGNPGATTPTWATCKKEGTADDFIYYSTHHDDYQIDSLQIRIGSEDYILIGAKRNVNPDSSENPLWNSVYKIKLSDDTVSTFGSGAYYSVGTSSAYNSGTLTITMSAAMTDEAKRRALLYGVYLTNNYYYAEVDSINDAGTSIVLKAAPSGNPGSTFNVRTRGGSSNAKVQYLERYANRLFAAGDASAPCRLYWSCVPGDGRTYEDWFMVEGDADASGGYVEVNAEDGDPIIGITSLSNQLLIFKTHSVWRLYGDRPSTFTLECVEKFSNAVSNRGVIVKHDTPYFLMFDGVYTYDGVGIVPFDNGASHLRRFFSGYNPVQTKPTIEQSRAAYWNNRFYFTCKLGASGPEDCIIVYDMARGTYMIRRGFTFADIISNGPDIFVLDGAYVYKYESGTTYDGEPILATWYTQKIDFGKKMYKHQVVGLYMQLLGGDVRLIMTGDHTGASVTKVIKKTTDNGGYVAARLQADQTHYFSFAFVNNGSGIASPTQFSIQGGVNIKALSELKE